MGQFTEHGVGEITTALRVAPPAPGLGLSAAAVPEVVTQVTCCEFMKLLNSVTSPEELVKPIPCPARTMDGWPSFRPVLAKGGAQELEEVSVEVLYGQRLARRT